MKVVFLLFVVVFAGLVSAFGEEGEVTKNPYISLKQHLSGPELQRGDVDGKVVVFASWPSH